MRPDLRLSALSLLTVAAVLCHVRQSQAQTIDFRYAPARWMTPIGFVDDWQKSMVLHDGALAYDFGPGPYARPTTTIRVAVDDAQLSHSQSLAAARVPIVETHLDSETDSIVVETLAVPPDLVPDGDPHPSDLAFTRENGLTGSIAWASPGPEVDPIFRSVAWGTGRAIIYRITVPSGARRRIALGFAEAHRKGRIKRELKLLVEGAGGRIVDLMELGDQNEPHVFFFDGGDLDGDGAIRVEVTASTATQDPNTILNGIWVFEPDVRISGVDVISGRARRLAAQIVNCGWELELTASKPRLDLMRATFDAPGVARMVQVKSRRSLKAGKGGIIKAEGRPFILAEPVPLAIDVEDGGMILRYPPQVDTVVIAVAHGVSEGQPFPSVPDFKTARGVAERHWLGLDLPWSRIEVPDATLQDLLDGSIRTVFQVRDVVDGRAQFQPGPTVYRGLWYGDGMWSVEGVTLLGDTAAARSTIEAMLSHQDSTGRAGVMAPPLLHRETAHMIYAIGRYARLSGDRRWMERHWGALDAAMGYMVELRELGKADPEAPYYGLFPPGLTDGGIGGINPEYGSSYWGMIAMAEAARLAEWIGKRDAARRWRIELDDFLRSFRAAADRDARRDASGNLYLPVLMNFDPDRHVAQRGQWGVIHSYYAGKFLEDDNPLLRGTLGLLESRTVEGHVVTVGWLKGGVWPIFEAHRALAYNRLGEAKKVVRLLYAFANHAAPTYVWAEEQMPRGEGERVMGDIPHTIGNIQTIRLLRYLLLLERDDHLEVFPSLPSEWLDSGDVTRLSAAPTEFGPVNLSLEASPAEAVLTIEAPAVPVVVATRAFVEAGFRRANGAEIDGPIRFDRGGSIAIRFSR